MTMSEAMQLLGYQGLPIGPELIKQEQEREKISTLPLSVVSGFPVEPELTSIGGLLRGERHSISGVTAGETALISDDQTQKEQI